MGEKYIKIGNLSVSEILYTFIIKELIPGTKIEEKKFWDGFDKSVHKLTPVNKDLLKTREKLQNAINIWHQQNKEKEFNKTNYKNFLLKIGYLKEEGEDFQIETQNIDDEISKISGPQLVVPVMNSRYLLNAANARWMSLYDSLYGTDVIESEESASERYDPERGEKVIKYTKEFLDKYFALKNFSWNKVNKIEFKNNNLNLLSDNGQTTLKNEEKFIGYRGKENNPTAIILKNNNLHIEIIINP